MHWRIRSLLRYLVSTTSDAFAYQSALSPAVALPRFLLGHIKVDVAEIKCTCLCELDQGIALVLGKHSIQYLDIAPSRRVILCIGLRTVTVLYGIDGTVVRLPCPCRCWSRLPPRQTGRRDGRNRPIPLPYGRQRHWTELVTGRATPVEPVQAACWQSQKWVLR